MLRSAASPDTRGVRPVRDGVSGLLNDTAPGRPPSWPDDSPALLGQLDQGDDAGLDVLGVGDDRDRLALALRHRVDGVLTGLEAHIRHAFAERGEAWFHRRGV